jgi:chloramphenicol-sensitive protein RarD
LTSGRASASGLLAATAAYSLWGVLPVYWKALAGVPPVEVLANRVLWSLLLTLALLAALGRSGELGAALRSPCERRGLAAASALIALNWGVFIWAVQAGRIAETSLGYYLNPLVNAAIAASFFGERLHGAQVAALALAALGVGVQIAGAGGVPWVALVLALSFACYGVAHKRTRVAAIPGLALETLVLAPLALGWLAFAAPAPGGALLAGSASERALLLGAGPITALPLLLFAVAAQRLSFVALGLLQYLAPTLSLGLAVLVYGEPFTRAHALSLGCIWAALAMFMGSGWWRGRRA